MKFLIVFTLVFATSSAIDFRSALKLKQRSVFVPIVQEDKASGRIISGQIAHSGQFPYQVSINSVLPAADTSFSLICSGTIISPNWIVTIAQCVHGAESVTIGYGSTLRSLPEVSLTVPSSDIIVHPAYFNIALFNDIALLKVPTITFSSTIQPAKLPMETDTYSSYAGEYGVISGWGKVADADAAPSDELHYGRMPIISNDECMQFYGPLIQPTTLCVSTNDGVSVCDGDAGAPIISENTGELVGLTSFGAFYPTCIMNVPDGFTRITSYLSWIKFVTGGEA